MFFFITRAILELVELYVMLGLWTEKSLGWNPLLDGTLTPREEDDQLFIRIQDFGIAFVLFGIASFICLMVFAKRAFDIITEVEKTGTVASIIETLDENENDPYSPASGALYARRTINRDSEVSN